MRIYGTLCLVIRYFYSMYRQPTVTKVSHNEARRRSLIPLGTKKLGVCGRMPGDPDDQIDFTKETNTIGKVIGGIPMFEEV